MGEVIFVDGTRLCIDHCTVISVASCDVVELRATKTGNLIFISTAHRQVGNAVVFRSPAASPLMSVFHCHSYSDNITSYGCCSVLE